MVHFNTTPHPPVSILEETYRYKISGVLWKTPSGTAVSWLYPRLLYIYVYMSVCVCINSVGILYGAQSCGFQIAPYRILLKYHNMHYISYSKLNFLRLWKVFDSRQDILLLFSHLYVDRKNVERSDHPKYLPMKVYRLAAINGKSHLLGVYP